MSKVKRHRPVASPPPVESALGPCLVKLVCTGDEATSEIVVMGWKRPVCQRCAGVVQGGLDLWNRFKGPPARSTR